VSLWSKNTCEKKIKVLKSRTEISKVKHSRFQFPNFFKKSLTASLFTSLFKKGLIKNVISAWTPGSSGATQAFFERLERKRRMAQSLRALPQTLSGVINRRNGFGTTVSVQRFRHNGFCAPFGFYDNRPCILLL
jgi:hypothetical protein